MTLFYTVLILLAICDDALAYLDPSSGTLIWQMLGAFFIAVLLQIKKIIDFLKSLFKNKR
jgi:hypothetical protein